MTDEKGCFSEKDRQLLTALILESTLEMLKTIKHGVLIAKTPKEKNELRSLGESQIEKMEKLYMKVKLNMCNPPEDIERGLLIDTTFWLE